MDTMGPMSAVHSKDDCDRPLVALLSATAALVGPPNKASEAAWIASILNESKRSSKQVRKQAILM